MSLVLDLLEIKNFRAFKHLRIEKLGRVNLIVGANNVGKTSLLEALYLYVEQGNLELIWEILGARDERGSSIGQGERTIEDNIEALKYLFHGRQEVKDHHSIVQIGPIDVQDDNFNIEVVWYAISPESYSGLGSIGGLESLNNPQLRRLEPEEARAAKQAIPYLAVSTGQQFIEIYPLAPETRRTFPVRNNKGRMPSIFIYAKGITKIQTGQLWDDIALTDLEGDVLFALRLICADVERVSLIAEKNIYQQRSPIVKLAGTSIPIPLRSLGEGMSRMFGIILALVNAKDGVLLIDEVDTGLHYSVLPDVWKLIFEVAHRLNVQVFATTHSWDCIQAFQQASDENKEEEGMLIRLEQRDGDVYPVMFNEQKLNIAARELIKVR